MAIAAHARILSLICGMIAAAAAGADSDEASLVRAPLPAGTQPLLALILDTSPATHVTTREPYDPARRYGDVLPAAVRCEPTHVYWRRGPGTAPDCSRQRGLDPFPADASRGLQCETARTALAAYGFHVASRAAQRRPPESGGDWTALRMDAIDGVECRADGEIALAWDRSPFADPYIFYMGNYLNWLRSVVPAIDTPYTELIAESLSTVLASASELDAAWIRVMHDGADGGFVAGAPMPALRAADALGRLAAEPPGAGGAPLAEALVESALWLSGGTARFGAVEDADPRAFETGTADRYRSPFEHACRPVTLAYVTAGEAHGDELAPSAAAALPGFLADTGGCDDDCLSALARWIAGADLRNDMPGVQSPAMRFLGIEELGDPLAFVNLAARSLQRDAAVPAGPQLSAPLLIDAPDAGPASDVVFALSAPRGSARWNGNLFRYGLRAADSPLAPPVVVDRDGENAIGADALPLPSARSMWSDTPDADLLAGGAAGRVPPAAARELFAELGDAELTAGSNRLSADNPAIAPSMLGLGDGDPESLRAIFDWLASERRLGDFGPNAPVAANYAEDALQVVFAASHDGWLQAFDADTGSELWAWMPRPLLPRLAGLMRDEATTVRDHGIDGAFVLHRHDPDGDGRIDAAAGEHLWLLFGLGRGGNRYYAIDVADPQSPRLLWSFELPGEPAAEARAEPVVTRIDVEGTDQNDGRWVVLLSGGYDRRFDSPAPGEIPAATGLLLVDALTGDLLWSAGNLPDAALSPPGLAASIAPAPRALDLDGNGRLDRVYAIDVAGGLWRFDFASGRAPAELAQARRVAQLGTGPQRFHGTPDVSLARFAGGARLAVSASSGWLARPLDLAIVDRVYTIFDEIDGFASGTRTEADLHDADTAPDAMPAFAPGWFRRLDRHGPGEKAIGPPVTFDGALHVQTWQPLPPDPAAPCGPPRGTRRRYAFDVRTGISHRVELESPEDEAIELPGDGLPVALRFGFPGEAGIGCIGCRPRAFGMAGAQFFDTGYSGDPVRTSWRKLAPPDSR